MDSILCIAHVSEIDHLTTCRAILNSDVRHSRDSNESIVRQSKESEEVSQAEIVKGFSKFISNG